MIGKKNIVFGFLYLVLTAALGPYMIVTQVPVVGQAQAASQEKVQTLRDAVDMSENAGELAKATADAFLAANSVRVAESRIDQIKGGPHAHGNLEALLNIAVGVVLLFLAIPALFKQIISWVFIAGALLHSGILYLYALQVGFAQAWLGSPAAPIGPVLVLAGLLLAGIAAAIGFKDSVQK